SGGQIYYATTLVQEQEKPQTRSPFGLGGPGAVRYLIARFEDYDNYRHLALHRLSRVEILDDPVQGMRAFDLNSYLRNGNMNLPYGERISLELLFYDQAGATFTKPLSIRAKSWLSMTRGLLK
ncbi:transcriptional factor MdcH, partial [Alcanivorax hongdengensis A-11-3]